MPVLTITLLDGFEDDEVVVSVDGVEVDRRAGVTTRLLLGLADQLEIEVPEAAGTVEVALPAQGLTATHPVPDEGQSLLATVENRELVLTGSRGGEGFM